MQSLRRPVHLNGPIGLGGAEEVFRTTGALLGPCLRRFPDGNTAAGAHWQERVFAVHPQFEAVSGNDGGDGAPRYAPQSSVAAECLGFDSLPYAEEAIASYAVFRRLRDNGEIPAGARFQAALPAPVTLMSNFLAPEHHPLVEAALEEALVRELSRIVAAIPAADLAVQWIVTIPFFTLETGEWSSYLRTAFEPVVDVLARLGDRVPTGVELGYHLCYGLLPREHLAQQSTASRMITVVNKLVGKVDRTVDWIHIPIPADRDDAAYFTPLAALVRFPDIEFFAGLIEPDDDIDRIRQGLAHADAHLPGIGVAAPCGLGGRAPDRVREALALHRLVAELSL